MRLPLGLAHEIGFAGATTTSIAVVLLGGALPDFAWLVCLAPAVSFLLAAKGITPPALSATLVGLASIALGGVTIAQGGIDTAVLAGAEVLMGLLAARLLVRRTPAHDMQALSLSLLLVLAGSVLNVSLSYIVVFVVYAVSAVWALSTRQLLAGAVDVERTAIRARTDVVTPAFFVATAAIALVVLASAALVFAAFPRVGFGDIGAFLKKESRLPGAVGLRGDPRLSGGTTVVARARFVSREAFDRGLYLRGAVYDTITLDGFSRSDAGKLRTRGAVRLAPAPEDAHYELTVMPVVGDTMLTLGDFKGLRVLGGGNANPNTPLHFDRRTILDETKATAPLVSAMRYAVAGGVAAPGYIPKAPARTPRPLDDDLRARFLQVPQGFDAPLRALVERVVTGARTPAQKANALRGFFLHEFRYSQEPPRFAASPLRTFLLEERQGHCEYFAAAYALLLRAAGVPARVIGGFQGGAWDDGVVVFAEKNAHAWVEWWDDDAGWIVDDATPLATAPREELHGMASVLERARRFWDDTVLDYSLTDQTDALDRARHALRQVERKSPVPPWALAAPLVLAAAAAGVAIAWRRRRRRAAQPDVHPLARAIVDELGRVTHAPVRDAATLREAVDGAGALPDALGAALSDALALYEAERFGGAPPDKGAVRRATKALRRSRHTR